MMSILSDVTLKRAGFEPENRDRIAAKWRAEDYTGAGALIADPAKSIAARIFWIVIAHPLLFRMQTLWRNEETPYTPTVPAIGCLPDDNP